MSDPTPMETLAEIVKLLKEIEWQLNRLNNRHAGAHANYRERPFGR